MILFVRENCTFCQDLPAAEGLQVMHIEDQEPGQPLMMRMPDGQKLPVPADVKALPALLVGNGLYIGKDVIVNKMKELAHAAA